MELLTAEQMRKADRAAIDEMNIPGSRLMESAGQATAKEIERRWSRKTPIAVICGKGNNGGDGFVVARFLARKNYRVTVYLTSVSFSDDAGVQLNRLPKNVAVVPVDSLSGWKKEKGTLRECGVIVDAIFGTGLSKPLTGLVRKIVEGINESGRPVVAVDIPSGIDATSGRVLGAAVRAHLTVTFARPKIGHILYPGADYAGEVKIADIGIPDRAVAASRPDTFLIDRRMVSRLLPPRPDQSHKGMFGRSLIIAGSRGMVGAAVLAAEAAMRIGSGLTQLCVPESIYTIAARKLSPEAMCAPIPDAGRGAFGPESTKTILTFLDRATCVLLGPGIGRHPKTVQWVLRLLKYISGKKKLILDADALFPVSAGSFDFSSPNTAITPHSGEMARLVGKTRGYIESHFCSVARNYSTKTKMVVVLKGSRTAIGNPAGDIFINRTGNAALAKGASGDVLAGMICGLASQGLSTMDAARLAVYLHGRAADIAVEDGRDKRTFLASDIFQYLDPAIRELSR